MYRKIVNKLKVVVCGGDGTVGWVLSTLDSLKWPVYPPIAVIPLGTGNDLSQTLGWGASFVDEPLSEILMAVADETSVVYLDRWSISTEPNKEATQSEEGASKNLPLSVMNNYFSIGADAQAALQFHESRTANPEIFNSRIKNRIFYAGIGTQDLFRRSWKDLHEYINLECDGVDMGPKLQELKLHCLVFLNIPKYAGGTQPWGGGIGAAALNAGTSAVGASTAASPGLPPLSTASNESTAAGAAVSSPTFHPGSISDGRIEVLGFTAATLAALQMGGKGERIAQCSNVKLVTKRAIPAQVDGEPCKLAPSVISIRFHSRVPMLQRITHKNVPRQSSFSVETTSALPGVNANPTAAKATLYTSVLLKLPVAVVSRTDYDMCKFRPIKTPAPVPEPPEEETSAAVDDVVDVGRRESAESVEPPTTETSTAAAAKFERSLSQRATPVGFITVEAEMDLDQVRPMIQRLIALNCRRLYTNDKRIKFDIKADWVFLDCSNGDQVYRLDPQRESIHTVNDICDLEQSLYVCHYGINHVSSIGGQNPSGTVWPSAPDAAKRRHSINTSESRESIYAAVEAASGGRFDDEPLHLVLTGDSEATKV